MAFSQTVVRNTCLYVWPVYQSKWATHPDPRHPLPFVASVTG